MVSSMGSMNVTVTGSVRFLYSALHVSFIVNPVKRYTEFGGTHLGGDEDSSLYLPIGHLHERPPGFLSKHSKPSEQPPFSPLQPEKKRNKHLSLYPMSQDLLEYKNTKHF